MKQGEKINFKMVFVIGAGRSGTTLLAHMLSSIDGFLGLDEKRYIWSYGKPWARSDVRGEHDCNEKICGFIRDYFTKAVKRHGNDVTHIVEKTPSNCFRVPFINKVFLDSKFIHIIRDGRDVALSANKAYHGNAVYAREYAATSPNIISKLYLYVRERLPSFIRRFQERDIPPGSILPYIYNSISEIFLSVFTSKPAVWGARYPGIYKDRDNHSSIELAAIQWAKSVKAAKMDLANCIPPENRLEIRYEDLVSSPKNEMLKICAFLDVAISCAKLEHICSDVKVGNALKWRDELAEHEVSLIERHADEMLQELGYK